MTTVEGVAKKQMGLRMSTRLKSLQLRQVFFFDASVFADFAFLTAIWVIASLVVNPVGEFPLIDDWSFSRDVHHFIETGDYQTTGWGAMTLVTHILWGSLFCLPAGFSFTALRLSCVVAGLLGLYGTYVLVRDFQQPRWLALLVATTVAFFPAYCLLSYTFMTDVPFATLAIWSLVCFARYLRSDSGTYVLLGTLLAILTVLCRQVGVAIPLAFAVIALLGARLTARRVVRVFAPFLICILTLFAYNYWAATTHKGQTLFGNIAHPPFGLTQGLEGRLFIISLSIYFVPVYIGLFLLPLLVSCNKWFLPTNELPRAWHAHKARLISLMAVGLVPIGAAACFLTMHNIGLLLPAPNRGNMLQVSGFGPLSFRDIDALKLDAHVQNVPTAFWIILTLLGAIGAALLLLKLSLYVSDSSKRLWRESADISTHERVGGFLILSICLYWLPFVYYGYYDRYLILLIPCLSAAVIGISGNAPASLLSDSRALAVGAGVLLLSWGAISVSGTRDFLALNRLRWQALHELMVNSYIEAKDVDGGAEFNGFYFYNPETGRWKHGDTYLIGLGPIPEYQVVKEYRYQQWFPPHIQKIVVMRRSDTTPVMGSRDAR